jgi:hypothetical protein
MKELINHLVSNHMDRIVERSLLDCHCKGLHSIMLLESPEQTIRLYVAEPGNDLYKNSPYYYKQGMSIGFHPHHCNLTLHVVKGELQNWTLIKPGPIVVGRSLTTINRYRYQSQITDGEQGFVLDEVDDQMVIGMQSFFKAGYSTTMLAKQIHTVATNPFELTAWLVYEGKEDPNYQPFTWSTSDLTQTTTEGLYRKPDSEQVKTLLRKAELL